MPKLVGVERAKVTSRFIDWIAELALETFTTTGRMTVIVPDNGSLHKSHKTCPQWQPWQAQGLFLFFLPPYCSQMNRIEEQWHQLLTHEIALADVRG